MNEAFFFPEKTQKTFLNDFIVLRDVRAASLLIHRKYQFPKII